MSASSTSKGINSTCSDHKKCHKNVSNSACLFGKCRCMLGYVPSHDYSQCIKVKSYEETCNPFVDNDCQSETLTCSLGTRLCKCAPGYEHFFNFRECIPSVLLRSCTLRELMNKDFSCKTIHNDFLGQHDRPRFYVVTCIVVIICCLIYLNRTSPNSHSDSSHRRSHRTNSNSHNELSLNSGSSHTHGFRHFRSSVAESSMDMNSSYPDNQPPPTYEEIFSTDHTPTVPTLLSSSSSSTSSGLSKSAENTSNSESSGPLNSNANTHVTQSTDIDAIAIQMPDHTSTYRSSSRSDTSSQDHTSHSELNADCKPPTYDEAINMPPI